MRELNVKWIKEKLKRMKRERNRELEEGARKEKENRGRRERNVVWRGVEGEDKEERRGFIEEIMWKMLGREVRLRDVEERVRETERWVLLTEMVE